jgi:hypothetical protein
MLDPETLDVYVGQYELAPKVLLTLRRERHHLLAQITGQPWTVAYAENETQLFWKVAGAVPMRAAWIRYNSREQVQEATRAHRQQLNPSKP